MFIIKLGGSVITDKTKQECFKEKIMNNLSNSMKQANQLSIVIHGAGSFGHILANKYKLNQGYQNNEQIKGFSLTHQMVQSLNSFVLRSLQKYDIPAVSISPHTIVKLNDHKMAEIDYNIFKEYLEKKFVPVTFRDVVLDKKLGFSICSGDLLVYSLAEHFKPKKIIFVIDEDGLYDSNPKLNRNARFIRNTSIDDLVKLTTTADKHADVTKGMQGKIETIINISKLGIDTILLNGNKPDRLYKALIGEDTKNTIVYGGKK